MAAGAWWTYSNIRHVKMLRDTAFKPADGAVIWFTPTTTFNVISLEITGSTNIGPVDLVTMTRSDPPSSTPATSTTTETVATTAFTYYPLYATHTISSTIITGDESQVRYEYTPSSINDNLYHAQKRSVSVSVTGAPESVPTGGCCDDMVSSDKDKRGVKLSEAHSLFARQLGSDTGMVYEHSLWRHIPAGGLLPFLWTIFSLFILAGVYFLYKILKELAKIFARHKNPGQTLPDIEKPTQGPPPTQPLSIQVLNDRQTAGSTRQQPGISVLGSNQPSGQSGLLNKASRPSQRKAPTQPTSQPQAQPQQSARITKLAIPVFKPI